MRSAPENQELRLTVIMLGSAVLLAAVALWTYLVWPQAKSYRQINVSYETLRDAVNTGRGLSEQISAKKITVDALQRQLDGDLVGLHIKQMESVVIGRLQDISWQTNVELLSVTPTAGQSIDNFREIEFEVKLSGDYPDFFAWLQVVTDQLGFVTIKHYDLKTTAASENNPKLEIDLKVVLYKVEQP